MPAFDRVKHDGVGAPTVILGAGRRPDRRLRVHLILFGLTAVSTLVAGAFLQGVDPLGTRFVFLGRLPVPYPTGFDPTGFAVGVPFAAGFLGFLLAHEMGHWLAARAHRLRVTLPYFIPFPPWFSLVGTLGAFIRIRSPVRSRRTLIDVGAAGPWAGFVVALPLLVAGLARSTPVAGPVDPLTPFLVRFLGEPVRLGSGPLLQVVGGLAFPDAFGEVPILLHPLALAGWLGLFVTTLNLLPVGPLDGGHILTALSGRRRRWPGRVALLLLIPLGVYWWGWWLWAGLAWALGRRGGGRRRERREEMPPGPLRRLVGVGALMLLPLTFVPVPLRV